MATKNYADAMLDVLTTFMEEDPQLRRHGQRGAGDRPRGACSSGRSRRSTATASTSRPAPRRPSRRSRPARRCAASGCSLHLGLAPFAYPAFSTIASEVATARQGSGGRVTVPATFHMSHGLLHGGASQHSESPMGMFWNVPGIEIAVPWSPADLKGLLRTALKSDNPTLVITHAFGYGAEGEVPDDDYEIPLGQAAVKREGSDVTIVACSMMVGRRARGRRGARRRGHRGRGDRPAHAGAARRADDPRLGRQDRPPGDRRRGPAALRRGVGDRRHGRASTASTRSRRRPPAWPGWTRRCPATRSRRPTSRRRPRRSSRRRSRSSARCRAPALAVADRLDHLLVLTDDIDATRDFWCEALGLEVGERPPLEFPGYWLYAGGVPACTWPSGRAYDGARRSGSASPARAAGAVDHVAFDADDYDERGRRASSAAGSTPPATPCPGVDAAAVRRGPQRREDRDQREGALMSVELANAYWTSAGPVEVHVGREWSLYDFARPLRRRRPRPASSGSASGTPTSSTSSSSARWRTCARLLDDNGLRCYELEFIWDWFLDEGDEARKAADDAAHAAVRRGRGARRAPHQGRQHPRHALRDAAPPGGLRRAGGRRRRALRRQGALRVHALRRQREQHREGARGDGRASTTPAS